MKNIKNIESQANEQLLPYGVEKKDILSEEEFEKYKVENKSNIEEVIKNTNDYHGYKYYTICFLDDTACDIFVKNK